jgi:hypothetical protein
MCRRIFKNFLDFLILSEKTVLVKDPFLSFGVWELSSECCVVKVSIWVEINNRMQIVALTFFQHFVTFFLDSSEVGCLIIRSEVCWSKKLFQMNLSVDFNFVFWIFTRYFKSQHNWWIKNSISGNKRPHSAIAVAALMVLLPRLEVFLKAAL